MMVDTDWSPIQVKFFLSTFPFRKLKFVKYTMQIKMMLMSVFSKILILTFIYLYVKNVDIEPFLECNFLLTSIKRGCWTNSSDGCNLLLCDWRGSEGHWEERSDLTPELQADSLTSLGSSSGPRLQSLESVTPTPVTSWRCVTLKSCRLCDHICLRLVTPSARTNITQDIS